MRLGYCQQVDVDRKSDIHCLAQHAPSERLPCQCPCPIHPVAAVCRTS